MNAEEKKYFEYLTKDRIESANVLEKPSLSGVQHSVVEKYSDQAHFIYELLQNADDVHATEAKFTLYKDKLVFIHNGTKHFNITNPATEAEDTKENRLGDLNAITSVAHSAKGGNKATIGKFGVGFKAVFQYTNTPYIYDPNVAFKIERFIVPQPLDGDYPGRKNDETVFVFPFDHKERSAPEAFEDIFDKLRHLVYPNLFLQHLHDISFEVDDNHTIGMYEKNQRQIMHFGDITAQELEMVYNEDDDIVTDLLWLFSRKDAYDRDYCVGFFMDDKGKLKPVQMPAFCYFPTKEETKLRFVIHAPFLLTDSREGIKAGEAHNKNLISLLAKLAGDSLFCFKQIGETKSTRIINDDVLSVIPINKYVFTAIDDKAKISFLPFYNVLKQSLENGLLPGRDDFYSKNVAYWADTLDICNLFSDVQLTRLLGVTAHWVFCSYGRNSVGHNASEGLQDFIDDVTTDYIRDIEIYQKIDETFIKKQSIEWLHEFYEWIADIPRRFNFLKSKPIFLNANGEPVAAYDKNGQKTLFLPSSTVKDCPTIHPDILGNIKTKNFLLDVVKLEEPSLQDYIYNTVIPNYKNDNKEPPLNYFKLFFQYYKQCRATEIDDYIAKIKDLDFLEYVDGSSGCNQRSAAENIYYPSNELLDYFSPKPTTHFLALQQYTDEYPRDDFLKLFLKELGVMCTPKVCEYKLSYSEEISYGDKLPHNSSTKSHYYQETRIDGCMELASYVAKYMVANKSYLLWNVLLQSFNENHSISSYGEEYYFYYSAHYRSYQSLMAYNLQTLKWLIDKEGNYVCPTEVKLSDLSSEYDLESEAAQFLIKFLGFTAESEEEPLTEDEKLAKMCKKYGLEDENDFREYMEWKQSKKTPTGLHSGNSEPDDPISDIAKDISKRAKIQQKKKGEGANIHKSSPQPPIDDTEDTDIDEFTPGTIDYTAKIEKEKEKQAEDLQELAKMQELQEIAVSAKKYSYLWFKTLLDMEILNSDTDSMNNREINISFGKIEREENTLKTYILTRPSKYIPQCMEDLTDIPLVIRMKDGSQKSVAIEVSSVQSYSLHVKLKEAGGLSGTDLSAVQEITIKATRPVFLLQALKEKLAGLKDANGKDLADDFNMKDNLPANLEFVFGPPGTGKTTYLANRVLTPLMQQKEDLKVLVLTPTNKAADVITTRIMDTMGKDTSYSEWLTRFGITGDERIENSAVFRDKTFDLRKLHRSVTITTIARFAYDFYMPTGERLYLDALNWDYIVIDEASMIPLVQIIYPIFRKTPVKFIIAGDPFQIEPITTVDLWADENIYKMVELNSFTSPTTEPHNYNVVKLTTQYRSTPEIGEVFSRFTYGGILQHNRKSDSRRDLHLDGIIDIDSLNVLRFPVSKYESIYRSKRLNGTTPYQVYSAIFTMEFVNFLSHALEDRNPKDKFQIGIIAPYKAQASLIDRLMSSVSLPSNVKTQVGTIHGFQGDECDVVFVILNTPPSITNNPKLFLNKQNVLNVAISRARDYLFIVMPDNQTENLFKLQKVKHIEDLMRQSGHFKENATAEMELKMFGNENFIEENAFATSHQTVNVYGQPEKRYEIRSEDTAVDVQVHLPSKNTLHNFSSEQVQTNISVSNTNSNTRESNHPSNTAKQTTTPILSTAKPTAGFKPYVLPQEHPGRIGVGDSVLHKDHGIGKVLSVVSVGNSITYTIQFEKMQKNIVCPKGMHTSYLTKL